jgi:hypothetical protein
MYMDDRMIIENELHYCHNNYRLFFYDNNNVNSNKRIYQTFIRLTESP